jgi:hypothetical protein
MIDSSRLSLLTAFSACSIGMLVPYDCPQLPAIDCSLNELLVSSAVGSHV